MKSRKQSSIEKTKVLIVSDYFYPHWTGISKSIYNLTTYLANDFVFTILTTKFEKNLKKEEDIEGVKILRENYQFEFSRVKYSLSIIIRFIKEVGKNDLVFINSPFSNILPVSILAKIFGKKLLFFHQGDLILPPGFKNRVIEKIFDISTLISFYLGNKVSTYTRDYANHSRVLKPFLPKFTPILFPIIFNDKQKNKELVQLKQLKTQGKIIFGFAGRFVEEKGFDILFDAIPEVVKKIPNAHFVFAGETKIPYEKFYEKNQSKLKSIENYLTFLGLLDETNIQQFYNGIDYIIVPSRSDCFNLAQAEAALFKKPIIISDIPGARVLVKQTGFGLIFKSQNPIDLSTKIIEAVNKKGTFMNHYPHVLELLDNNKNIAKIKEYIEN